eukprot:g5126.t1
MPLTPLKRHDGSGRIASLLDLAACTCHTVMRLEGPDGNKSSHSTSVVLAGNKVECELVKHYRHLAVPVGNLQGAASQTSTIASTRVTGSTSAPLSRQSSKNLLDILEIDDEFERAGADGAGGYGGGLLEPRPRTTTEQAAGRTRAVESSGSNFNFKNAVEQQRPTSPADPPCFDSPREELEKELCFLGLLYFRNALKPCTASAIKELKQGGVQNVMVTGDNVWNGLHIGKKCGLVDDVDSQIVLVDIESTSSSESLGRDVVVWSRDDFSPGGECSSPTNMKEKIIDSVTLPLNAAHRPERFSGSSNASSNCCGSLKKTLSQTPGESSQAMLTIDKEMDYGRGLGGHDRQRKGNKQKQERQSDHSASQLGEEEVPIVVSVSRPEIRSGNRLTQEEVLALLQDEPAAEADRSSPTSPEGADNSSVVFAVTQAAFSFLQQNEPETLSKIFPKIAIFGSMNPSGKVEVVQRWAQTKVVGMCGDGGNDCAALKMAHVGMALVAPGRTTEVSIVSPFSASKANHTEVDQVNNDHHNTSSSEQEATWNEEDDAVVSIHSVVTLCKEGRCALENSVACYKFFIYFGLLSAISKMLLQPKLAYFSELHFFFQDAILLVLLTLALSNGRPHAKLATITPEANVLGAQVILDVLIPVVIQVCALLFTFWLLEKVHGVKSGGGVEDVDDQKWYSPADSYVMNTDLANWADMYSTFVSSLTGIWATISALTGAVLYSIGGRFRRTVLRNYLLVLIVLIVVPLYAFLLFEANTGLNCVWRVNCDDASSWATEMGPFSWMLGNKSVKNRNFWWREVYNNDDERSSEKMFLHVAEEFFVDAPFADQKAIAAVGVECEYMRAELGKEVGVEIVTRTFGGSVGEAQGKSAEQCILEAPLKLSHASSQNRAAASTTCQNLCEATWSVGKPDDETETPGRDTTNRFYCWWAAVGLEVGDRGLKNKYACYLSPRLDVYGRRALGPDYPAFTRQLEQLRLAGPSPEHENDRLETSKFLAASATSHNSWSSSKIIATTEAGADEDAEHDGPRPLAFRMAVENASAEQGKAIEIISLSHRNAHNILGVGSQEQDPVVGERSQEFALQFVATLVAAFVVSATASVFLVKRVRSSAMGSSSPPTPASFEGRRPEYTVGFALASPGLVAFYGVFAGLVFATALFRFVIAGSRFRAAVAVFADESTESKTAYHVQIGYKRSCLGGFLYLCWVLLPVLVQGLLFLLCLAILEEKDPDKWLWLTNSTFDLKICTRKMLDDSSATGATQTLWCDAKSGVSSGAEVFRNLGFVFWVFWCFFVGNAFLLLSEKLRFRSAFYVPCALDNSEFVVLEEWSTEWTASELKKSSSPGEVVVEKEREQAEASCRAGNMSQDLDFLGFDVKETTDAIFQQRQRYAMRPMGWRVVEGLQYSRKKESLTIAEREEFERYLGCIGFEVGHGQEDYNEYPTRWFWFRCTHYFYCGRRNCFIEPPNEFAEGDWDRNLTTAEVREMYKEFTISTGGGKLDGEKGDDESQSAAAGAAEAEAKNAADGGGEDVPTPTSSKNLRNRKPNTAFLSNQKFEILGENKISVECKPYSYYVTQELLDFTTLFQLHCLWAPSIFTNWMLAVVFGVMCLLFGLRNAWKSQQAQLEIQELASRTSEDFATVFRYNPDFQHSPPNLGSATGGGAPGVGVSSLPLTSASMPEVGARSSSHQGFNLNHRSKFSSPSLHNLSSTSRGSDLLHSSRRRIPVSSYNKLLPVNGCFEIDSVLHSHLVPGDLIEIESSGTVPCDCVVIQGSVVVNESNLTGEAMPIQKFSLEGTNEKLCWKKHAKKNILSAGTTLMQSRGGGGSSCGSMDEQQHAVAVVLATGAMTTKGRMIRSIIYAEEVRFELFDRLPYAVFFASIFASVVCFSTVFTQKEWHLLLIPGFFEAVCAVSRLVSPLLLVGFKIAQGRAARRMKGGRFETQSLNYRRIPMAGKLEVMCWDKTGTLTEESLNLYAVQGAKLSRAHVFSRELELEAGENEKSEELSALSTTAAKKNLFSVVEMAPMRRCTDDEAYSMSCNGSVGIRGTEKFSLADLAASTCDTVTLLDDGVTLAGNKVECELVQFYGFEREYRNIGAGMNSKIIHRAKITSAGDTDSHEKQVVAETVRQFEFDQKTQLQSVVVDVPEPILAQALTGSDRRTGHDSCSTSGSMSRFLFAKGSPLKVGAKCRKESLPENFAATVKHIARSGYYLLALAGRPLSTPRSDENTAFTTSRSELEKDLVFLGLLYFKNELKPCTGDAIEKLRVGGITNVMVTGDNLWNGLHVAKESGLICSGDRGSACGGQLREHAHAVEPTIILVDAEDLEAKKAGSEGTAEDDLEVVNDGFPKLRLHSEDLRNLEKHAGFVDDIRPEDSLSNHVYGGGETEKDPLLQEHQPTTSLRPPPTKRLVWTRDVPAIQATPSKAEMGATRTSQLFTQAEVANVHTDNYDQRGQPLREEGRVDLDDDDRGSSTSLTLSDVLDLLADADRDGEVQVEATDELQEPLHLKLHRSKSTIRIPHTTSRTISNPSKSKIARASVSMRTSQRPPPSIVFGVTQAALTFLSENEPELLEKIFPHISIFGGMNPNGKIDVIRRWMLRRKIVGMCGDGGNDCGALKMAHVGMALVSKDTTHGTNEVSIVSPFSSSGGFAAVDARETAAGRESASGSAPAPEPSIHSVVELIAEGRCALENSVACYQYFMVHGCIEVLSKLLLQLRNSYYSEMLFLFRDAILAIALTWALASSGPRNKRLAPRTPTANILGCEVLAGIGVPIAVNITTLILLYRSLDDQEWFSPPDEFELNIDVAAWWSKQTNFTSSVSGWWNLMSCVSTAVIFSFGGRHRRPWFRNAVLVTILLVFFPLWVTMLLTANNPLNCAFRMNCDNDTSWSREATFQPFTFFLNTREMYNTAFWFKEVQDHAAGDGGFASGGELLLTLEKERGPEEPRRDENPQSPPFADVPAIAKTGVFCEKARAHFDKQSRESGGPGGVRTRFTGIEGAEQCILELPEPRVTLYEKQHPETISHACHKRCQESWTLGKDEDGIKADSARFFCWHAVVVAADKNDNDGSCFLLPRLDARGRVALGPEREAFVAEKLSSLSEGEDVDGMQLTRLDGVTLRHKDHGHIHFHFQDREPLLEARQSLVSLPVKTAHFRNVHNVLGWTKAPAQQDESVNGEEASLVQPDSGGSGRTWGWPFLFMGSIFAAVLINALLSAFLIKGGSLPAKCRYPRRTRSERG